MRSGELKPGMYVLFKVSDTGPGMDEATKEQNVRSSLYD
jgi:hypothetical protein